MKFLILTSHMMIVCCSLQALNLMESSSFGTQLMVTSLPSWTFYRLCTPRLLAALSGVVSRKTSSSETLQSINSLLVVPKSWTYGHLIPLMVRSSLNWSTQAHSLEITAAWHSVNQARNSYSLVLRVETFAASRWRIRSLFLLRMSALKASNAFRQLLTIRSVSVVVTDK